MKPTDVFIDEATIYVQAGKGADGRVNFRREKFVPRGGPDGGDGGRGGSVILVADRNLATLMDQRYRRVVQAGDGISGAGGRRAGANGADVDSIGTLFEGLVLKRFDTFNTKFRTQEILPQHWQVISELDAPDDDVFDRLPEVGNLRQQYRDQELARRRLGALKVAWRELRGKSPGLWQVPDLMAAIRRIIDKQIEVDFNDLLHAARDLWLGMTLPVGKEQVEILWACIALVRKGTKK